MCLWNFIILSYIYLHVVWCITSITIYLFFDILYIMHNILLYLIHTYIYIYTHTYVWNPNQIPIHSPFRFPRVQPWPVMWWGSLWIAEGWRITQPRFMWFNVIFYGLIGMIYWDNTGIWMDLPNLVMTNIAIQNSHRNSWFNCLTMKNGNFP